MIKIINTILPMLFSTATACMSKSASKKSETYYPKTSHHENTTPQPGFDSLAGDTFGFVAVGTLATVTTFVVIKAIYRYYPQNENDNDNQASLIGESGDV